MSTRVLFILELANWVFKSKLQKNWVTKSKMEGQTPDKFSAKHGGEGERQGTK